MSWGLFQNSMLVAGGTALLATIAGIAAGVAAVGAPPIFRKLLLGLAVAALALPPFLVANTWLFFFGLNGTWRGFIDFDLYSLKGTVLLLALQLWPIGFLLFLPALLRLDRVYLEQEPSMRGTDLIRYLVWPGCRSVVWSAALITFVLALNSFSIPALLQTKVFSAEVWLNFNTQFDYGQALLLSWPLIVSPVLLLLLIRFRPVPLALRSLDFPAALWRDRLGLIHPACSVVAGLVVLLSLGLPVFQLIGSARTWAEFFPAIRAGTDAAFNSILFACGAAGLVMVLGVSMRKSRFGFASWLLFLVPGVLLGIALIRIFNRPMLSFFYGSAGIVLLAFALRYAAFGWSTARAAFALVEPASSDVVTLFGASRWQRFVLADWPQVRGLLLASFYLAFLFCLWEVETLVLIVPPGCETLSLRVFNMLHYGHAAQVDALCVWILLIALAPLALFQIGSAAARRLSFLVLPLLLLGCGSSDPNSAELESRFFGSVQVFGKRGTGAGEFNKPRSIAVDREDNFYVADMTGRVQKFSPEGQFLLSWQMPQTDKGKPKGMACDRDGNIIVVEPHYSRANHFSPEGKLVAQWGMNGTNAGELFFPRAVAVNSHGDTYLSEYGMVERIQHFTHLGREFKGTIGGPGTARGELNRAEGIGLAPDDILFVADSCNHRVQVFSPEGKLLTVFGSAGSGPNQMSYPYDVRVDSQGFRFVCEFGNSRVQIFDRENRSIEILGGPGAAPGLMNNPWAIALDSRGNLYVADSLNHRVQKFMRRDPLVPSPLHTQRGVGSPPFASR